MIYSDIFESDGGLYAWTNISGDRFRLDCCIWVALGDMCAIKKPIVIFTKNCKASSIRDGVIIDLTTLEILLENGALYLEMENIFKWIGTNHTTLLNHWNGQDGYSGSEELIDHLKGF